MKYNIKKHPNLSWSEIKSNDSWSIFKIMSEFVEGYETLQAIGPASTVLRALALTRKPTKPHVPLPLPWSMPDTESSLEVVPA